MIIIPALLHTFALREQVREWDENTPGILHHQVMCAVGRSAELAETVIMYLMMPRITVQGFVCRFNSFTHFSTNIY